MTVRTTAAIEKGNTGERSLTMTVAKVTVDFEEGVVVHTGEVKTAMTREGHVPEAGVKNVGKRAATAAVGIVLLGHTWTTRKPSG